MRRLRYHRRAIADIDAFARLVARDAETFAAVLKLKDALLAKCDRLAANPAILGSLEPEAGDEVRRINYKNFRIFLRYSKGQLSILRILHASTRFPR